MFFRKNFPFLSALAVFLISCAQSGGNSTGENTSNASQASKTCKVFAGTTNCPLDLSFSVSSYAGGTQGSTDGTGLSAQFDNVNGITSDGTNLYLADTDNHRIRKIVIATAVSSTLAGSTSGYMDGTGASARFNNPRGITTDGTNLFVADTLNSRIRKIVIATGEVTTLAGSGGTGSADGTGSTATFNSLEHLTTDGNNLYVTDLGNHRIRKIAVASGEVTTLAGNTAGYVDATGTAAAFSSPRGITNDGTNLYVADSGNHRIRKIVIATGVVSTVAGATFGSADGIGSTALFASPRNLTTDGTYLYIADTSNFRVRRTTISTGVTITIAGSVNGHVDGVGNSARISTMNGIATDGKSLYISAFDMNYRYVRRLE